MNAEKTYISNGSISKDLGDISGVIPFLALRMRNVDLPVLYFIGLEGERSSKRMT